MGLKAEERFLLFWATLGAAGFILIWNLPWRFQVNDDTIMMWLVSGAYTGEPESYAVFIHPVISWVFSEFYSWIPDVNWYGGTWFFVIAISYLLLVRVIAFWESDLWLKSCFALILLLMAFHFCFFPQFTLVSGLAAFASLSFLFSGENGKSSSLSLLCLALFVVGILIRWESVVLIGLGFGIFRIFTDGLNFFKPNLKKLLLVIFLFFGIVGTKFLWEANSVYADFLRFNRIRARVIDHPVFHQQIIDQQISPSTDFYFFSRWYFEADQPTESELQDKKKELDTKLFSFNQLINSFKRFWNFQKMEAFKSFMILFILILFFLSSKRIPKLYLFFSVWILFFMIFNHFFLLQGRVVFLFFLCFMFPAFAGYRPGISPSVLKPAIFLTLFLFSWHSHNFLKEARGRSIMEQEFSFIRSSMEKEIPLVFEGYQEHNSGFQYSTKNPVPFLTTGWISRSPFQKKALKRFGLNGFGEIKEYALFTPDTNLEIVFPSYMDYTYGDFQLKDSIQTSNFIFLHFAKE